MIYTMLDWPQILTQIISKHVARRYVVLKIDNGKIQLMKTDELITLEYQNAFYTFFEQPIAKELFSNKLIFEGYDYLLVDLKKGRVILVEKSIAEKQKHNLAQNLTFTTQRDLTLPVVNSVMRRWLHIKIFGSDSEDYQPLGRIKVY